MEKQWQEEVETNSTKNTIYYPHDIENKFIGN